MQRIVENRAEPDVVGKEGDKAVAVANFGEFDLAKKRTQGFSEETGKL